MLLNSVFSAAMPITGKPLIGLLMATTRWQVLCGMSLRLLLALRQRQQASFRALFECAPALKEQEDVDQA
jgi:hypothetical protein